jgi:hypothetical protein
VSVDAADEPSEWPWAGPDWRDHVDPSMVSSIVGIDVAVPDPSAVSAVWGQVLGVAPTDDALHTDDAIIRFVDSRSDRDREGITAIDVTTTDPALAGATRAFLGVTLRFLTG